MEKFLMYDAITIDTSILRNSGYKFDSGILSNLKQFREGPTQLLISEIVVRETYKHILAEERDRQRNLKNISKSLVGIDFYSEFQSDMEKKSEELDPVQVAQNRINKFVQDTGAIVVLANSVTVDELTAAYFNGTAPFDTSGNKKNEFPDAIALFGIKNWAREHGKRVLGASKDKDWMRFSEIEESIDVIEDLKVVLHLVQQHSKETNQIASAFVAHMIGKYGKDDLETLRDEIEYTVTSMDVMAECSSSFHCEEDYIEIELNDLDLPDAIDQESVSVVRYGSNEITFLLDAEVSINATAYFNLSIWDSIDKEYVGMGSSSSRIEDYEFDGSFLVTLSGNLSDSVDKLAIRSAELIEYPDSIDFGDVEMDYGDYEPHEDDHLQLDIFEKGVPATTIQTDSASDNSGGE